MASLYRFPCVGITDMIPHTVYHISPRVSIEKSDSEKKNCKKFAVGAKKQLHFPARWSKI